VINTVSARGSHRGAARVTKRAAPAATLRSGL